MKALMDALEAVSIILALGTAEELSGKLMVEEVMTSILELLKNFTRLWLYPQFEAGYERVAKEKPSDMESEEESLAGGAIFLLSPLLSLPPLLLLSSKPLQQLLRSTLPPPSRTSPVAPTSPSSSSSALPSFSIAFMPS